MCLRAWLQAVTHHLCSILKGAGMGHRRALLWHMQSAPLTPGCLGLTLGHSGGEGEYCGADPLGIGQPQGLEQWLDQAANWLGITIEGLLIPL